MTLSDSLFVKNGIIKIPYSIVSNNLVSGVNAIRALLNRTRPSQSSARRSPSSITGIPSITVRLFSTSHSSSVTQPLPRATAAAVTGIPNMSNSFTAFRLVLFVISTIGCLGFDRTCWWFDHMSTLFSLSHKNNKHSSEIEENGKLIALKVTFWFSSSNVHPHTTGLWI